MSEEVKKKRGRPKGSVNKKYTPQIPLVGQPNNNPVNGTQVSNSYVNANVNNRQKNNPLVNHKQEPDISENNFSRNDARNNLRNEKENTVVNNNNNRNNNYNNQSNETDDDADLKAFLKKDKKQMPKNNEPMLGNNDDFDESIVAELEGLESSEGINDIPSDDFNPLDDAVKQRGYTDGITPNNSQNNNQQERVIEEPNYVSNGANKLEVDETLINPSNDIPNESNNGGGGNGGNSGGNNNTSGKSSSGGGGSGQSDDDKSQPVQESDNLKELSPKEKKEAMEKTADAILLAYKQYIPLPFVYFASYDNKKLEKLHNADEINLETQVRRDGTTFREYAKEFNGKVDKAFEVSDEEVEALKEPLVDVLMEQEFAFTPTQRLMFVGGQFLVAKVMMCVKFLREKKSDIQEMKDIHAERMEEIRRQYENSQKKTKKEEVKEKPNVTFTKKDTKQETPKAETSKSQKQSSDEEGIVDAEIISETKNPSEDLKIVTPTLEDALNAETEEETDNDNDHDTNDIPD